MTHAYRHMDVRDCGDDRATWSLLAENAQLRRLCAQSKDLVARHELALREGDHRIKNSLQIVASLMGAQERRETNPAARQALRTATSRIQAVARIHDALQLTGGADDVSLGALIETMCTSLHAMAGDSDAVEVIVDAEFIHAPIRLAQPVVLITNELVLNALRHAFPEGRPGAIQVSVSSSGGQLCIIVADDGVGLPVDYQLGLGFGMKFVRMMAAKIGGTLSAESKSGARFTLCAPLPGRF